jgi:hypothetical protein
VYDTSGAGRVRVYGGAYYGQLIASDWSLSAYTF